MKIKSHLCTTKISLYRMLIPPKTVWRESAIFLLLADTKKPFKDFTTNRYVNGATFEDIVILYEFDERLRSLFLFYILKVERHIKSLISYHFADYYGEDQSTYLDPKNYHSTCKRDHDDIAKLTHTLSKLAKINTDYPYINHHRQVHKNVPLWVLTGALTFGNISKMYQLLPQNLQAKISMRFAGLNEKQLRQTLTVMTKFRNVCAHGERLFSYTTKDDIPDSTIHRKLGIAKHHNQYICGKHDLFAIVISLYYLLPKPVFIEFKAMIVKELLSFSNKEKLLTERELLKYTGFPSNWKNITRYKI